MRDEEDYLLKIKRDEIPIFEITSGDNHYRIYYSGKVDGFAERVSIVNQCPLMYRAIWTVAAHPDTLRHQQDTTTLQTTAPSMAPLPQ